MLPRKHNYNKTGWGFIILSIVCVVIFLIDYKSQIIFRLTSISELGTILAGTSGIFASLAGLFFVLENLELQRKTIEQQQVSIDLQSQELKNQIQEMKESNAYFKEQSDTLKLQTSETTFFQLLENHRSLVESLTISDIQGYQGLNKFYTDLKRRTIEYYQTAHTGNVSKSQQAQFYPLRSLTPQIENVEQIYNDTLTVILFISQKLGNQPFYHQIFYNSLSKAEKYILGMYIVNEKKECVKIFNTPAHNYLAEFEGSGNAYFDKDIVPFFPYLDFTFMHNRFELDETHIQEKYFPKNIGNINITVLNNEHGKKIKLEDIIFQYEWYRKNETIAIPQSIFIESQHCTNISTFINEHITTKYFRHFKTEDEDETRPSHFSFYFELIFCIQCNKRNYKYKTRWRYQDYSSGETRTVQIISQDK